MLKERNLQLFLWVSYAEDSLMCDRALAVHKVISHVQSCTKEYAVLNTFPRRQNLQVQFHYEKQQGICFHICFISKEMRWEYFSEYSNDTWHIISISDFIFLVRYPLETLNFDNDFAIKESAATNTSPMYIS